MCSDPGRFRLSPGFQVRACAPPIGCFFTSRLAARETSPHPTLPHRGGGLADDACDRRSSAQTRVVFIACRAKARPLDGGGLGGGDAAQRTAIAAGAPPAILPINRASRHATSTYWEASIHFEP